MFLCTHPESHIKVICVSAEFGLELERFVLMVIRFPASENCQLCQYISIAL